MILADVVQLTTVVQAHQALFFCALALIAETVALALAPFLKGNRARWWRLLALIPLGLLIWSLVLESQFVTIYQRFYLLLLIRSYPPEVPEAWSNYATQVMTQASILEWATGAVTVGLALLGGWAMFRRLRRRHTPALAAR